MVGKVNPTDMRTDKVECRDNYHYTNGSGNPTHVNTNRVRALAAALALKSNNRIDTLDPTTRAEYDELIAIINKYQPYPSAYEPIYNAIIEEFRLVTVATPGTIAAAIKGGDLSGTCGSQECNPMFINSVLKNPAFMNRVCDKSVLEINDAGILTVAGRNHTSNTANVFLESANTKFTADHTRQIKNMGISNVVVYAKNVDGGCVPMHDGKTVNVDTVVVNGGGNTTVVGGFFNRSRFSNGLGNGGNRWWWWLIGIIFLILIIVAIILIIWLIVRAVKSKKKVDEVEDDCGRVKKCINYAKSACGMGTTAA